MRCRYDEPIVVCPPFKNNLINDVLHKLTVFPDYAKDHAVMDAGVNECFETRILPGWSV
jgi:hypothetical protein